MQVLTFKPLEPVYQTFSGNIFYRKFGFKLLGSFDYLKKESFLKNLVLFLFFFYHIK